MLTKYIRRIFDPPQNDPWLQPAAVWTPEALKSRGLVLTS